MYHGMPYHVDQMQNTSIFVSMMGGYPGQYGGNPFFSMPSYHNNGQNSMYGHIKPYGTQYDNK